MRLISQDKKWDIPYESSSIHRVRNFIKADTSVIAGSIVMGEYETESDADSALLDLWNAFAYDHKIFKF